LTLVLGGARSGKSRRAEALAEASGLALVYVATAEARDDEMAALIAHHRIHRNARWSTVEAPLDLAEALGEAAPARLVLVDCLTLWLSNLLLAGRAIEAEIDRLCEALPSLAGPAILVSNEVGLGIVPDNALARAFRDHQGRLNQRVAALAERVEFMAAGLALRLKP
jgi:adenosylcobinamide kinase/adenosylcobinamide-phosphate guanylyltransferase